MKRIVYLVSLSTPLVDNISMDGSVFNYPIKIQEGSSSKEIFGDDDALFATVDSIHYLKADDVSKNNPDVGSYGFPVYEALLDTGSVIVLPANQFMAEYDG